jgi:hypothetical protein
MDFKSDLNERERLRYSRRLREIAKAANEAADALELEDDGNLVINIILLSLHGETVNELGDILKKTALADLRTFPGPPPRVRGD